MMKYTIVFLFLFIVFSCKKNKPDEPTPVPNEITFSLGYMVDANPFYLNSKIYMNKAGNKYSISRLEYYISQLCLIKPDSSKVLLKDYQYVNATVMETNKLTSKNVPAGKYIGICFNIGVDSIHNIEDGLPVNTDNVNMIWPMMMGGGYHFLKLEGYFDDPGGVAYGFAMHLGTNSCLVPVKLFKEIFVAQDSNLEFNLTMNVNEWFQNPNIFDFNADGNYIMGNAAAMLKIAQNGVDVFSF